MSQEKVVYTYELPHSQLQLLCDHLDELNVWSELAVLMSLKTDEVQAIRRQIVKGHSPTDELLKIWGGQYNHTVLALYCVLFKQRLFTAMEILKDFVDKKYHLMLPSLPRRRIKPEILLNQFKPSTDVKRPNSSVQSADTNKESSVYLNERNVKAYASSILEINYSELVEATCNWSERFILGKGGFGTVYKGNWKHTDVAIKLITYCGSDSIKVQIQQSLNELKYLNACRHDNVLPLYGYSIKGERPCLVYQLMKGGSLEQRLNAKGGIKPLTWQQRISICLGTARGLNYLHTFREKPLIHGDIKPANILLDVSLEAKIGDFGLAREGPNAINTTVEVKYIFGTKPYLPPEFLQLRKLSTKVDTYSFGVVLLETFTGMRAFDRNRDNKLLTKHILTVSKATNVDLIDKSIPFVKFGEKEMCGRLIELSLECIAESAEKRPEMEHVLKRIDICNTPNSL